MQHLEASNVLLSSVRTLLVAMAGFAIVAHCAPTGSGSSSNAAAAASSPPDSSLAKTRTAADIATTVAPKLADASTNKAKLTTYELDTQETGHYLPPPVYIPQEPVSYGYGDANKNAYAKQASDWSLYDQGAHGLYDKYGDKAWTDNGYQSHASHGKHDSHSNVQNSHGSDQGSGYYSRDRGYGYERQYAFDRVVDSKSHSNNQHQYANSRGLQDHYGAKNDYNFNKGGHEKFGLANKYGHGYRSAGAHDDYAHGQSAHYPPPPPPPPPLYKSNYYSNPQYPQMPSYY